MRASIRIALALLLCAPWALAQLTDIGVSQTGPTTAPVNTDVTYTITVFNDGTTDVSTAQLADALPFALPTALTFTSLTQTSGPAFTCTGVPSSGTPIAPGDFLTCSIGTLPAGASAVFSVTVHIPAGVAGGTTFTNGASVAIIQGGVPVGDEIPENDSVGIGTQVSTPTAHISVLKTAPEQVASGARLTYSLTVVNAGPDSAASVALTDTLPGNLTFAAISQTSGPTFACSTPAVGAGGTVTCTLASMPAGATAVFSLATNVPAGTPSATVYTNMATFTTSTFDPDYTPPDVPTATFSTTVSNADVSVNKTGPTTSTVGSTLSYTLTVLNNGPDAATAVLLTDALPATTRFASLTQTSGPTATCSKPAVGSSGTVTCNLPTLASGQTAVFTLSVTVSGSAGGSTISNTATVSAYSADPNPANNAAIAQTTVPAVASSIPTLSDLGLWLLGLAILAAGWVALRRDSAFMRS